MKSSATSSGFGLSGLGELASAPRRRSADVVVVGAGISGLVAAQRVASSGRSVVVLEARPDRVGGRLESAVCADVPLDVGGACVGASHHRLNALIDQLGLSTWPAHDGGQRTTVHDWPEWGFPAHARRKVHRARIESAKRGLDALAGSIDRESPWASP
ncbi:MAG: monoamine oxidase, partial [Thermoleophilaceae bacterium]|nr:monoamine oxidase [Thermoleophilaceae bacterium]